MPTYEFGCPAGHEFEKFYRTIGAAPAELPCPECDATAVRRVSGGAGLLFKGSGFYITDYGRDGKKGEPANARAGGAEGGTKPGAAAAGGGDDAGGGGKRDEGGTGSGGAAGTASGGSPGAGGKPASGSAASGKGD